MDLLLPSGLGVRARPSVNARPGVQSRGVQWATDLSRMWGLDVGRDVLEVPVPSLLGAVVAKASALLNTSDHDPERHLSDLVFLAEVATREDLAEPLREAGPAGARGHRADPSPWRLDCTALDGCPREPRLATTLPTTCTESGER